MKRFMTLSEVAETLSISMSQAYALVRSGELPAIQIGGRNQWRVEEAKLQEYIDEAYRRSREILDRPVRDPLRGSAAARPRPSAPPTPTD